MTEEKNEFDDLGVEEDTPEASFSETPETSSSDEMISKGAAGKVYDWNLAPEGVKAPPRVDLNGKIVTIKKAEIILPPESREWQKSRSGTSEYKYCSFILFYDIEGQQEFHSGCRVFKRDENGKVKYSHPTIMRDRKNQSSKLLGVYADYKSKDINEVSLKEFMAFLNGQPKAMIKTEEVTNPTNGDVIKKNFVEKFVEQNTE